MTFSTLDSTAVGDGAADTLPADTFLQNRIADNVKNIAVGHDAFTVTYANNNTDLAVNLGDRPWCANAWISVMLADLPDWNKLTSVKITMLQNVQSDEAGAQALNGSLRFTLAGKTVEHTASSTYSAASDYTAVDYTITLDAPIVGTGTGTLPLEIWFKSRIGGAVDGVGYRTVTFFGSGIRYIGTYFTDPSVPGPVAASFEIRILDGNNGVGRMDVLGAGVIDSQDSVWVYPTPSGHCQVDWKYASYLQVRAIRIKPIFADDSVGSLPTEVFEPNKIFGSVEAQRTANAINRLEARPRVLSVGPRGQFGSAELNWTPRTYPTRFGYIEGDGATKTLVSDVAFLRTENPKIRVVIRYTSLHVNQNSTADEGSATWDLDLTAKYSDGTSIGTSSVEVVVPLFPAYLTSPHPLLRTWQFAMTAANPPGFAYKEGSLYDEDTPLIRTAVFDFDITGHNTATNLAKPVEIRALVGLSSVEKYCSDTSNTTAFINFLLVGYTIIEVPK